MTWFLSASVWETNLKKNKPVEAKEQFHIRIQDNYWHTETHSSNLQSVCSFKSDNSLENSLRWLKWWMGSVGKNPEPPEGQLAGALKQQWVVRVLRHRWYQSAALGPRVHSGMLPMQTCKLKQGMFFTFCPACTHTYARTHDHTQLMKSCLANAYRHKFSCLWNTKSAYACPGTTVWGRPNGVP